MKKSIFAVLFAVAGFVGVGMATAATLNVSWTAPTTRVSGAALTPAEIAGYEITLNGVTIASPNATALTYSYTIAEGNCINTTDLFAIRVKDTDGVFSNYSTNATVGAKTCTPKSVPTAPTLLKIVVQ